jgi:hypothetical protein
VINGVLVVLYHAKSDLIKSRCMEAGGTISRDIFFFSGGNRFQFIAPSVSELPVWLDKYKA